jgi:RimJ/RimL family protein N-acetyltransferase
VKWLGDGEPVLMKDLDEALGRIERFNARSTEPPRGIWAIERRSDGLALGTVLLLTLPNDEHGEVEIGWHLHPDSWGHGYATEAARAVLTFAFDTLRLPEVVSFTAVINLPSRRVMEKLGMRHDPAEDFDHPRVPAGSPVRRHVLYRIGPGK